MMRDGMIHELDVELWDQTMAVNLRGYMLWRSTSSRSCSRAAAA